MNYKKKFLLIGNRNISTCKGIFHYIKDKKIWYGVNQNFDNSGFIILKDLEWKSNIFKIDNNGNKYVRIQGVVWYTNLKHNNTFEKLVLEKEFSEKEYVKYDNYNAININKVKDIPRYYEDIMGVPITFFDRYDPEQFEVLGNSGLLKINGKYVYRRILIKNKMLRK